MRRAARVRRGARGALPAALAAWLVALPPALPAAAQDVATPAPGSPARAAAPGRLSPDDMRGFALGALVDGRADIALSAAEALLRRDPADPDALLIRARALADAGRLDTADTAARAAWGAADTPARRYRAALLRAQILSRRGARTRSQIWLRRAVDLAPDARSRAAAVRDYRYVRSRNPLRFALDLDVAPTSNVNNGSSRDVAVLFGLPFELIGASRALSGLRLAAGGQVEWRGQAADGHQDRYDLSLFHQTFRLSDEARRIAPDARGSDFAYTSVRGGWQRLLSAGPGRGLVSLSASAGQGWYGGDPFARSARAGLGFTRAVGDDGALLRLNLDGTVERRLTGSDPLVRKVLATAALSRPAGPGRITAELSLGRDASRAAELDFAEAAAALRYELGRPVLGTRMSVTASMGLRDFDASPYRAGGRRDIDRALGVDLFAPSIERYGFTPVLTIEGRWRSSNVDLYDSRALGLRLGVRSAF